MKISVGGCTWLVQFEKRGEAGVWLTQECGWPFATLSCWPSEYQLRGVAPLEPGYFWLKDWGENRSVVSLLEGAGLLEFTGRVCPLGQWATAREAKLKVDQGNS